jgi:hypothetical protein
MKWRPFASKQLNSLPLVTLDGGIVESAWLSTAAGTIPSTEDVELFNITPGSIKEPNEHLLHINDTEFPDFTIESYTSVVMLQHFICTQCSHWSHDTALLVFITPLLQWTQGNLGHLGGPGQGCTSPHNIKLTITNNLSVLTLLDTT